MAGIAAKRRIPVSLADSVAIGRFMTGRLCASTNVDRLRPGRLAHPGMRSNGLLPSAPALCGMGRQREK